MNVKRILSRWSPGSSRTFDSICIITAYLRRRKPQKGLDNRDHSDVIIFTCGLGHDSSSRPPAKARNASSPRHPQPPAGNRHASSVPKQRVLRPRRSATGQVRDAASGPDREKFHQRFCTHLGVFPSVVLPSPIGISAGGNFRPLSPQTRPAKRTQTHRRSDGVYRPAALRRSFTRTRTTGPSGSEAISTAGASPQHRTTLAAGKKTALKPAIKNNSEALRTAYENLRAQVLAGHRGPGLVRFLRQGMREWLEVCGTTVVATIEPVERTTSAQIVAPDMRSEIVLILAGLFLQKRGEVHG